MSVNRVRGSALLKTPDRYRRDRLLGVEGARGPPDLDGLREAMDMASGNTAREKPARSWSQAAPPNERIAKPRTGERQPDSSKIDDIVDEWGRQSFPASDPPSNW